MGVDMSPEAVSSRLYAMGDLWELSIALMDARPSNSIQRPKRSRALEIQDSIRQILLWDWDPIGVSASPGAVNEYDSYISPVYRVLVGTRSEQDIENILCRIEREEIGTGTNTGVRRRVAEKLLTLAVTLN